MSLRATRWAYQQTAGGQANKAVLLALADCANADGVCTAGVPKLAAMIEASDKTVRRALIELCESGLIEKTRRYRANGSDSSAIHTLKMPKVVGQIDQPPVGQIDQPPVGHIDHPGGWSDRPPLEEVLRTSSTNRPEKQQQQPRTRGAQRAADLNDTARLADTRRLVNAWKTSHGDQPYTDDTYDRITSKVDQMLREGQAPEVVARALRLWDAKPDAGPGLLPYLYDQALKTTRAPTPAEPALSTADKRVLAAQALKAELAAERAAAENVIHLPQLPGAAS